MRFSSEKCKVMAVNKSDDERNSVWRLAKNEVQQIDEHKYMEVWLSPNGCAKAKKEKRSLVNQ